jgi:hypothetical protein
MVATNRCARALGRIGVGALFGLLCHSASAELGSNWAVDSGQASAASPLAGATLFTQQRLSGVTLRQYVNPAGLVFAVAWEGPVLPDFRSLLGAYFPRYTEALRQQNRHVHILSSDLIVDAGGMMRAFSGHAYLPAYLPPTLSGADIH